MNAMRFNQVPANTGLGLELKVIAAVVVGGTAITGGRGTLAGTVLGVVLLGAIGPALTFLGVSAYWERAIQGAIILVAVAADALPRRTATICSPTPPGAGIRPRSRPRSSPRSRSSRSSRRTFFTLANFFEIARLNAELGLLAVALTPILITGGIDLSVGAMMGLAAVCFGAAWRDLQWPIPAAAAVALAVGLCRRRAERRADFPAAAAGADRDAGHLLAVSRRRGRHHRSRGELQRLSAGVSRARSGVSVGRDSGAAADLSCGARRPISSCCIDRSSAARCTRSASAPAARGSPAFRSRTVSGSCICCRASSRASPRSIYVAHLGQARSDAGNGYELDAITAVVLGGTSVFGGRGTLGGTVLGLAALSVLKNGLQLAALPTELTGILTGVLLVSTIAFDRSSKSRRAQRAARAASGTLSHAACHLDGAFHVKNSQVAVLVRRHPARLARRRGHERVARAIARFAGRGAREADGHRDDAEGEGRSVFRELPRRRRGGGRRARRRSHLGRPDGARCRAPERARRKLDHPRRRRDCRRGRKPREHLDRAAKSAGRAASAC